MNNPCDTPSTLHTIGHSTRNFSSFAELLAAHSMRLVIDVRRWPASRRYPHFNREPLAAALKESGIDYLWRGDLGGFRKPQPGSLNTGWRVAAFRAYGDFMLTEAFERIAKEIEARAERSPSALMCAEAVPWRCHRRLLADAFLVRGWTVRHIMDDGCHEHGLTEFAAVDGIRIVYEKRPSCGEIR